MSRLRVSIVLVSCCLCGIPALPQQARVEATWEAIDARPTPAWFEDAKFGIFIHWGVYSVPSFAPKDDPDIYARYAEWYWKRSTSPFMGGYEAFRAFHDRVYGRETTYEDFAPRFTAEMFEPSAWARLFERSGARYVVLTAKHHDGFCLWPSPQSPGWNSLEVGPRRDLAGDLAAAVRAEGLRMGFYYSLYEWMNPLYSSDVDAYVERHMLPQMKDLVSRYEPDLLWTDGEWDHPSERWRATEFLQWLFNESPVAESVAVNDRWGKETRGRHGGYYTTEYGLVHADEAESEIPHPWEECRGIGHSFGYNRAETLEDYATARELIELLVDTVARGGNLLLDVGPTADGRIPVISEERLQQIGNWLRINGDGIYGTRRWRAHTEGDTVRYTAKDSTVYAIVLGWPGRSMALKTPRASAKTTVKLLGVDEPLTLEPSESGLEIIMPDATPRTWHAYTFELTGVD